MPLLIYIVVVAFGFLLISPVFGQTLQCMTRHELVAILANTNGESQQAMALTDQGVVMEFWANSETGTWTQIASGVDGTSCLVSSGQAWGLTPSDPSPRGNQI